MADRRRQIELLLATRFDLLHFPAGHLRTSQGLAPSKRVACPDCGTTDTPGWRVDAFKRRTPCVTCGGRPGGDSGRDKPGKGVVAVDPMDATRQVVGSTDTHASSRPRKRVKCDRCQTIDGTPTGTLEDGSRCPYCDGTGWRDQHVFELHLDVRDTDGALDAMTAAIIRRDQAGSYHELDLALAGIARHLNKPLEYQVLTDHATQVIRLLDDVFLPPVSRDLADLSAFDLALVDLAFRYLDSRMPDPIRVPGWAAASGRNRAAQTAALKGRQVGKRGLSQRDNEIRKLLAEHPPAIVARMTGLSPATVYAIRRKVENVA